MSNGLRQLAGPVMPGGYTGSEDIAAYADGLGEHDVTMSSS